MSGKKASVTKVKGLMASFRSSFRKAVITLGQHENKLRHAGNSSEADKFSRKQKDLIAAAIKVEEAYDKFLINRGLIGDIEDLNKITKAAKRELKRLESLSTALSAATELIKLFTSVAKLV